MRYKILIAIILLASVLRLWQLGSVPSSPDWDEVALGYNAYSIMQTGKDEYGQFFPLIMRSFDDYKPALYIYLVIPFIKFFGLEVFAVRLPSAAFGILTVVATYFLLKELFKNSSLKLEIGNWKLEIPEVASLLLAISPWHIQFSRIAFESNVGLAFNVFIVLFFLKGLKRPWLLPISAIFAGLNFHMYQNEKIFTPLLLLILLLIFRKEILAISKKYLTVAFVLGFIIVLPLIVTFITSPQTLLRAKGVSIFSDQTPFLSRTVERLQRDAERNDILGLMLDNRRITYGLAFINGYISHFDFNWLFITGDEARHHAPNMGLLYLWELPFLLIGIYSLIMGEWDRRLKFLIFAWVLITPIPASITTGVPHAVRTLNFLPTWQIFTAIGMLFAAQKISNLPAKGWSASGGKYLIFTLCFLFFIFNFSYYLDQYFVQQNYLNSQAWQYGYKEAISEIKKIELKYDQIVVTNKPHLDQSYMFFLFYTAYDPVKYQSEGGTVTGGFAEPHRGFSKYTFRPIDWGNEEKSSKILYVGRPTDFPDNVKVIKTINFLDGQPAIKIVEG